MLCASSKSVSIFVMHYKVHPFCDTRQREYNHRHPTSCFAASARFYGNYTSSWRMIIYALAVTFNSVPLFCPWSINKLFTCQKNNDGRSELQEWVKAEKWEVCAALLPGEKVWERESCSVPTGIRSARAKSKNEPQQGQATLHPAAKSSNF